MLAKEMRAHHVAVEAALAAGEAARSAIVASWNRSVRVHGLDPALRRPSERLTQSEFAEVTEAMAPVLHAARPSLDRLFQVVGGLGACVILADRHGVPVDRRGHPSEDLDFAGFGLWTGTRWSEAEAGTNGIGTCLAEGRAVTICRDQHFLSANIGLTCMSAPLHDADGRLVAVLDVSSAKPDLSEAVAGLISHAVLEAARRIEADLFRAAFPEARLLLAPGLDRGAGALLAVDAEELVIGATRAARAHFGLKGDLTRRPVPAADLLGVASANTLEAGERAVMARALARVGGNVSAAARDLGISRATFHRKLGNRLR
ncbi:GAF domain-containing protein [Gemmobacter fulva]|nr:GAF domain-containing protein [Gemmobacter fulvus]